MELEAPNTGVFKPTSELRPKDFEVYFFVGPYGPFSVFDRNFCTSEVQELF